MIAKAFLVPLARKSSDALSDDGKAAHLTPGSSSFSPPGLALDTPRVTIFLNVRHSLLERVPTLRTEKMAIVPMFSYGNYVFA